VARVSSNSVIFSLCPFFYREAFFLHELTAPINPLPPPPVFQLVFFSIQILPIAPGSLSFMPRSRTHLPFVMFCPLFPDHTSSDTRVCRFCVFVYPPLVQIPLQRFCFPSVKTIMGVLSSCTHPLPPSSLNSPLKVISVSQNLAIPAPPFFSFLKATAPFLPHVLTTHSVPSDAGAPLKRVDEARVVSPNSLSPFCPSFASLGRPHIPSPRSQSPTFSQVGGTPS